MNSGKASLDFSDKMTPVAVSESAKRQIAARVLASRLESSETRRGPSFLDGTLGPSFLDGNIRGPGFLDGSGDFAS